MLIPDLPRTSPERQGIASSTLLHFVEALDSQLHDLHSFMLLRHGSVVAEGWWSPYRREYPHMVFSLSKSFTSTAVGLAVAEGYFSIDDPVLSFFPDEATTQESDYLAAMRVRHLLSMTTGHTVDTWAFMVDRPDGNWIKGFFEVPVVHAPGTHFLYNTGATYMLSAIVQKITGARLISYLEPRLFEPLGIEHAVWDESPQGIATGGVGLRLTTEDIARFGQLYLQKGIWQGRRLLSEAWITEATNSRIEPVAHPQSDWTQGYGYQFWRCRHGAYRGDGVFGQYCIIMPEQNAVLAITGGIDVYDAPLPLNLVWDLLLPAMSKESLVEASAEEHRLTEKLSSLTLLPVQGRASSPIASQVVGRTYHVDVNDLSIETIALHVTESGWTVNIKTTAGIDVISCGYDVWQPGQTTLFNDFWVVGPTPVVASGAWTAEENFTMVVRLYETPFFHTLVYHFVGDEMLIETWVNASLEATKTLLLTAHTM
ncbi:MAG TPA: serine hydrolase [Ktedonosporobacter sp.]|nr:serine hydrolase [Ktedonosporobacter sp.]